MLGIKVSLFALTICALLKILFQFKFTNFLNEFHLISAHSAQLTRLETVTINSGLPCLVFWTFICPAIFALCLSSHLGFLAFPTSTPDPGVEVGKATDPVLSRLAAHLRAQLSIFVCLFDIAVYCCCFAWCFYWVNLSMDSWSMNWSRQLRWMMYYIPRHSVLLRQTARC